MLAHLQEQMHNAEYAYPGLQSSFRRSQSVIPVKAGESELQPSWQLVHYPTFGLESSYQPNSDVFE